MSIFTKQNIDEIKELILDILRKRKHSSLRGLAAEIGISSVLLKKLILNMRKDGIIRSWELVLNPFSNQQRIFFLLLKTNPNEPRVVNELLSTYDKNSLSSLEGITGEFSLVCKFHFPDTTEFLDSLEYLYELIGETGFQNYQMIEVIKAHKEHGMPVTDLKREVKQEELRKLQLIQKMGERFDYPPSTYEIAKELGNNQSVIYRKLERWKKDNIILGYSIDTPYWQEKFIHSYIQIKAPLGKYKSIIDFCIQDSCVIDVYRTNQEYSLILKTRHSNLSNLNDFLKILFEKNDLDDTLTRIVLDFMRGD